MDLLDCQLDWTEKCLGDSDKTHLGVFKDMSRKDS